MSRPPILRVLTLSGSLRAQSINTSVLQAMRELAPAGFNLKTCFL